MAKAWILVVDDEQFVRNSLQGFLEARGYEARATGDPRQAAHHVRERHFDLVLVDMMMPEMDGFQLASRLRQIRPGLRIVMFTGKPSHLADARAADLGFYEFLPKSNWYDLLIPTIERVLASPEPPRRTIPDDLLAAGEKYAAEGKFELASGVLEEAARDAEFDHQWTRAATLYRQAGEYYGRAKGVATVGRERLDALADTAERTSKETEEEDGLG